MSHGMMMRISVKDAARAFLESGLFPDKHAQTFGETIANEAGLGPMVARSAIEGIDDETTSLIGSAMEFSTRKLVMFVDPLRIGDMSSFLHARYDVLALESASLVARSLTKLRDETKRTIPSERALDAMNVADGKRDSVCVAMLLAIGASRIVDGQTGVARPMLRGLTTEEIMSRQGFTRPEPYATPYDAAWHLAGGGRSR